MSRKRALKKRADFRKGGFVDRKKFQTGGVGKDTKRHFARLMQEDFALQNKKKTAAQNAANQTARQATIDQAAALANRYKVSPEQIAATQDPSAPKMDFGVPGGAAGFRRRMANQTGTRASTLAQQVKDKMSALGQIEVAQRERDQTRMTPEEAKASREAFLASKTPEEREAFEKQYQEDLARAEARRAEFEAMTPEQKAQIRQGRIQEFLKANRGQLPNTTAEERNRRIIEAQESQGITLMGDQTPRNQLQQMGTQQMATQQGGRIYNPTLGVYYDPADAASGDPERQQKVYTTETGGTPTTVANVIETGARANQPTTGFAPVGGSQATVTSPEPERLSDQFVEDTGTGGGTTTVDAGGTTGTVDSGSGDAKTDRRFGARTTPKTTAPGVSIDVAKGDPNILSTEVFQIDERTPTAAPEDVTADRIGAAQVTEAAQAQQPTDLKAATMDAVQAEELGLTEAAQGQVTREATAEGPELSERAVAAQRDAAQEQAALATAPELDVSEDAFVKRVVGDTTDVVVTTPAEKQQREAVLGMPAPSREEAQIINDFGFGKSKTRVIRGDAAKEAASNRLVAEHGVTKDVADSILEDVGQLVTNIDGVPQEALGAVADLPTEALVSSQMESLLAGMEEGKTPAFARPAVAMVEQMLAERGLSASSVGRDALFNAIIQSAIPIAQSNAQALQQRASQNLSNEQQALIQDRQIAADFMSKNAAFTQQMELANLTNDQQMRLANLTALNQAGSENLSAAQQTELADLNARMQTNLLQGKLAQEMGLAQLTVDQQTAMQNASMSANIDFTKYSTEQQIALANSKFMQTMTMADFNANQQTAMQNATAIASMDLATADQNTKLAIENARNFLSMDMANLTNEQQGVIMDQQLLQQRLLSNQSAENAAAQFNATSENQVNQFMAGLAKELELFNASQINAMKQFNASESNRIEAINAGNDLEADKINSQMQTQVEMYDQELNFKRDQFNASNAQAVEQSNMKWRRDINTINTAAQNEANRAAASMSFNMSMAEQNFMWQTMRDDAAYAQQSGETRKERAMQVLSSIYGNVELMTDKKFSHARDVLAKRLELLLDLY